MGFLRGRLNLLVFPAVVAVLLLVSLPVFAGMNASETQLRVLFIKKITKYIKWPGDESYSKRNMITIAAVRKSEIANYFKEKEQFKVVSWPSDKCQVLFFNTESSRDIAAVLKRISDRPILTIGKSSQFLKMGGIINLKESGGRIKLQVNICAAQKAGLNISSKLLRLSEIFCGADPR
jgi:hypothetical protein